MEVAQAVSAHRSPTEIAERTNRVDENLPRAAVTSDSGHPRRNREVSAFFCRHGSACGPVIVPVFKTGGRRAIPSPVGSTPTRFRHFPFKDAHRPFMSQG